MSIYIEKGEKTQNNDLFVNHLILKTFKAEKKEIDIILEANDVYIKNDLSEIKSESSIEFSNQNNQLSGVGA